MERSAGLALQHRGMSALLQENEAWDCFCKGLLCFWGASGYVYVLSHKRIHLLQGQSGAAQRIKSLGWRDPSSHSISLS